MTAPSFPKVATLKTAAAFRGHLEGEGITLPFDDTLAPAGESPLGQPIAVNGARIGNRFCVLPMEGWDGTADGKPSELTTRRWRNFGRSGAKLIWGGEAVAVCTDGRANPNQLVLDDDTKHALAELRQALGRQHEETFGAGAADDLYIGLQLTHSGRYARPYATSQPRPLAAYAHPVLDARFPAGVSILSDGDLDRLVEQFVRAARLARDIGFQFVDVKHCHGYLLHELLSARARAGTYGGSLENRTRFLRDVVAGIRADAPGLEIGVRLSVFDSVPFRKGPTGRGEPEVPSSGYTHAFGLLEDDDVSAALDEARRLLRMLTDINVRWVCTTAGSPYYCPHLQRPAAFPPSDGYEPPEDPLRGVARQIDATAILKSEFPGLLFVGSGYTYLQEWLPHVAQCTVRTGRTDFVGLGRAMLSYPELPADVLAGRAFRRKAICRTFSDCTTGPRLGLVSGCYPLDPYYTDHPDASRLRAFKAETDPP
jgi:2,4-dienoyl-CoA reductase-like NADH-dependent reductase (Old Yellow Enzyme family)